MKNKKEDLFIQEVYQMSKKLGHRNAGISLAKKIYTLSQKTFSTFPNNQYSQLSAICTIKASSIIRAQMNKLARELPKYDVINDYLDAEKS